MPHAQGRKKDDTLTTSRWYLMNRIPYLILSLSGTESASSDESAPVMTLSESVKSSSPSPTEDNKTSAEVD